MAAAASSSAAASGKTDDRDLVIVAKQVYLSDKKALTPASVYIKGGKIASIGAFDAKLADSSTQRVIHVNDKHVVLPGVVDSHVHVNEPGRTEWEGFDSATRAAARGGVTCLADMPLNSIPPTTSVDNFRAKQKAATGKCWIDCKFIGGVVNDNPKELKPMLAAGVVGFKCFLINSGVEEFHWVTPAEARTALNELKGTGAFLMYHAELEPEESDKPKEKEPETDSKTEAKSKGKSKRKAAASKSAKSKQKKADDGKAVAVEAAAATAAAAAAPADGKLYSTFLHSRPCSMENRAIELVIQLCRESRVRCHIVHLSSAEALPLIRAAKKEGLPLTVETCYHYLYFNSEAMPEAEPRFKCCPPIREKSNREELWGALADGTIDLVVSDHSPCTENLKARAGGDYMVNWGGISSVQFGLSILHTAASERATASAAAAATYGWPSLVRWLSEAPAALLNLQNTKGKIAAGFDADLVVFDPTAEWKVTKDQMLFKNKLSAYDGSTLKGRVEQTILRGSVIVDNGNFVIGKPTGQFC